MNRMKINAMLGTGFQPFRTASCCCPKSVRNVRASRARKCAATTASLSTAAKEGCSTSSTGAVASTSTSSSTSCYVA